MGSIPTRSTNKERMKKSAVILIFILWFLIGILYVSLSGSEEKEEFKEDAFETQERVLNFNDSISIDQIKRMDSLHAAGKDSLRSLQTPSPTQ